MATFQHISQILCIQDQNGEYRPAVDEEVIHAARETLNQRFQPGEIITSPSASQDFFRHKIAELDHEKFVVLWLDNKHRVIDYESLFRGTIDGCSVYPREVVKSALNKNAAACIFAHNHPSGDSTPSLSDEKITRRLKDALALVDVRVLDHIVTGSECYSFAEQGRL